MDPSLIIGPAVALIGIGVGYLGGVQKGKADLTVERERTQQLREGRDEERRKDRARAYTEVLDQATRIATGLRSGGVSMPAFSVAQRDLENSVNAVLTIGDQATHEPGQSMLTAFRGFDFATQDLTAYEVARGRFVAAVHADVGGAVALPAGSDRATT